jgi:vacuolar-type H+-ATPase subunit D/Vma8
MLTKFKDTVERYHKLLNKNSATLLVEFLEYLKSVRISDRYQNVF